MDPALTGLRVLREIVERGSFTAAAGALGYTQSAVSRQVAALERTTGAALFDRRSGGVALTAAGRVLLGHAIAALEEVDAAEREIRGLPDEGGAVRLGVLPSAGVALVPGVLAELRRRRPDIEITTRDGSSPALIRAVRTRAVDLAILTSRPPYPPFDLELPPLDSARLGAAPLQLAVPATGRLAHRDPVDLDDLRDERWVVSPSRSDEPMMGVWPGLRGRPVVAHSVRDWTGKLALVAAGAGITTVPRLLAPAVPPGVRLVDVIDASADTRRLDVAWLPGQLPPAARELIRALRRAVEAIATSD